MQIPPTAATPQHGKNTPAPPQSQPATTPPNPSSTPIAGAAAAAAANIIYGKNVVTPEVEAAMADFVKNTMSKGVAGLRKEFAQLKIYTSPQYKFEAFSIPNNTLRNRYKDVVCLDSSRVVLNLNVPPDSDYIHANNIKIEGLDRSYIATQGPLETTISDFWRLVHQESATSIVMLY
uniref:Tyrosine-protein phosphatase domain-containing protein n=1 Tax=Panagrolaimus superbus TaxID=310955 RepID=A0A914YCV0_9BILA